MDKKLFEKAERAVKLLFRSNKTVSTAESCTGGMISQYITAVSGASVIFEMGICSYSSRIKNRILGVKGETLEKYGAVSRHTACEMAMRVREIASSDIGLSVTGVAGPEPCEGKEVGTVYIAIADKSGVKAFKIIIEPISREHIRKSAVDAVFEMLYDYLTKEN